jgi:RNA polymerase sigma factor (sigma-70 family)
MDSLDAAYLLLRGRISRSIAAMIRDQATADDLTQEVYLRARKALENTSPENLNAFLWQIGRNLALDHLRSRKTASRYLAWDLPADMLESIPDIGPSAEQQLKAKDDLRVIMQHLEKLPRRARAIWLLSRLEGWSYPKIAQHLNISPNTVFNDMKMVMGLFVDLKRRMQRDG